MQKVDSMVEKNGSCRESTGWLRRKVAGSRVGWLIRTIVAKSRQDG